MKKISIKLFASVSLIIAVTISGIQLTVQAAPDVIAWGLNRNGQVNVPGGLTNVVSITAGAGHSLAVTADGRVMAWGGYGSPGVLTNVPSGLTNAVAVAAGESHSLALTTEGRVIAWGSNLDDHGETDVPSGLTNVVAIAAGCWHSLALTADGRVVAWGMYDSGQTNVPSGLSNAVAIAAGYGHSVALTASGQVVAWGANYYGQADVPTGLSNVVAIAAGAYHNLALTSEGRVVAWGYNEDGWGRWFGQATVPSGLSNVVAIAGGGSHSLALSADGRMVGWGAGSPGAPDNDNWGQGTVPSGLSNVVAIAAGGGHSLALRGSPPSVAAPSWICPWFLVATVDRPFHYRIIVKNGATAYGAAGLPPGLALDPNTGLITGQATQAGKYPLVISATNIVGSSAWTITLVVNGWPTVESSGLARAGLGCAFQYVVTAYNQPEWFAASGLPAGLALDARTGVISGVPIEFGDFAVSLVASNRHGSGIGFLTIRVSPVVAWGNNDAGQADVPPGLSNVVAVAAGGHRSFALRGDGTVAAWGSYSQGETYVPAGLTHVAGIAVGGNAGWWFGGSGHVLALRNDGTVLAWGQNWNGQTNVPAGLTNVVEVAAGGNHSLALRADGTVVAWGANYEGQTNVPAALANAVEVAAGGEQSLALRADGTVIAWGTIYNGTNQVPADAPAAVTNIVAIAAGAHHSLALRADGTVAAWGAGATNTGDFPNYGQSVIPDGLSNVVAVTAGGFQSVALRADGTVVVWGRDSFGATNVPAGLTNVVATAAGDDHVLALIGQKEPFLSARLVDRRTFPGGTVYWRAAASGAWPITYQWQFEGADLPGATNAVLELTNVQASQAGAYSVRVSNPFGTVTSPAAHLRLAPTGPLSVEVKASWTNVIAGYEVGLTGWIDGWAGESVWDFADGTTLSNWLDVSHAWAAPGDYTVVLRAYNQSNPGGVSATVTVHVVAQPVYYVAAHNVSPVPPYMSWATAATNIQDAVDAADAASFPPGSPLVLVTNGVYAIGGRAVVGTMTNRLAVTKALTLRSVNGPEFTVIQGRQVPGTTNGDGAIRCVYLADGASLSGFTLTNGATRSDWDSADAAHELCGGGLWCESTNAVVSNCLLVGNSANWDGGGARGGTLNNCALSRNSAGFGGGAFEATLNNCTLTGNSAKEGGGAFISVLNNCTLTGNSASLGGGGVVGGTLNNCTLTGNSASGFYGGGGARGATLNNCIVFFNTAANGANYNRDEWTVLDFCCTTPMPTNGVGNITNAPLFVDYAGGNLRLQSNSPCITAGRNAYAPGPTDLDGLPRIVSGTVDIGAYEFQGPGSLISYAWLQQFGLPINGSADATDPDADGHNTWQEWRCVTDPTNALSVLRLLTASRAGTNVTVSWQSVAGVNYFLERSTDLAATPPFTLLSPNLPGQPGTTTFIDTNAAGLAPLFYRVGVGP